MRVASCSDFASCKLRVNIDKCAGWSVPIEELRSLEPLEPRNVRAQESGAQEP